jgi:hypothetical protein
MIVVLIFGIYMLTLGMECALYSIGLTYLRLWSYRTNMSILEEMRLDSTLEYYY